MPHHARTKSSSGYYHVVPKGIGNQLLFEDDLDRKLYVELLREAKGETGIALHAYCLMSNHTHLVVEAPQDNLADAMKYLHERYAMAFAGRTGRTGGVFRRPYWSEPIESDNYLLCAVRYVHANPAAAGICRASAYEWSSAKDYLGREGIADTAMVLDMLGGKNGFIEWSNERNSTAHPFPGSKLRGHLLDEEAARITRSILGREGSELAAMDPEQRIAPICSAIDRGLTIRQLMRVTGLGKWQIQDALMKGGHVHA